MCLIWRLVLDLAFDLGPDVTFCAGDHVVLQPMVYPGVDFLWSDNSTADSLLIAQSGNYYLDISIGDCVQSDTVVVDVIQPIEPVVIYDDFYCTNEYEVDLPIIPATTGDYYYQNHYWRLLLSKFHHHRFTYIRIGCRQL